jgi:hypothetical protein
VDSAVVTLVSAGLVGVVIAVMVHAQEHRLTAWSASNHRVGAVPRRLVVVSYSFDTRNMRFRHFSAGYD